MTQAIFLKNTNQVTSNKLFHETNSQFKHLCAFVDIASFYLGIHLARRWG